MQGDLNKLSSDLSKLSSDDIRKFGKAISDAKALPARQEEIAKKVLATEKEIGNVRLAALEEFFDVYSKGLDEIIARKTSQLNDAFLIMEQKAIEGFKRAASEITKATPEQRSPDLKKRTNDTQVTNAKEAVASENDAASNTKKQTAKQAPNKAKDVTTDTTTINETTAVNTTAGTTTTFNEQVPLNNYSRNDFDNTAGNSKQHNLIINPTDSSTESSDASDLAAGSTPEPVNSAGGNTPLTNTNNNDNNNKPSSEDESGDDAVEVRQITSDSALANLGEEADAAEEIVERLKLFGNFSKSLEEQLADIMDMEKDSIMSLTDLEELRAKKRNENLEEYKEKEKGLCDLYSELMLARAQADENSAAGQEYRLAKIKDLQLANLQEVMEAEYNAINLVNELQAERAFAEDPETQQLQERKSKAADDEKSIQTIEERRLKYIATEELRLKQKNNRELTAYEKASIIKTANEKYKLDQKSIEEVTKKRKAQEEKSKKEKEKETKKQKLKDNRKVVDDAVTAPLGKDNNLIDRFKTLYRATEVEQEDGTQKHSFVKALDVAISAISSLAKQLDKKIDEIGKYKGEVDTRLHGSSSNKTTNSGSYWDQIVKDMTRLGAITPFYKQSDFAENIKSLVDEGIAFDLEQRAFLKTIEKKIATTFDVADATLLRLIRIQQADTTAGRLGMEAALNAFLNNMYENTEYLKKVANSVRNSLTEMQSLMESTEAAEVEYQVQKWLGSLYSVGMSDTAVNSISNAFGQIAAGQVDGLTNGGAGNLLIMAASEAGLSIADILSEGINADETNELLQAVVNYLADIANSTKDNQVVQQQMADVFGVKASDLRAATNLTSVTKNSVSAIYNESRSYNDMLTYLTSMVSSMGDRISTTEKLTNVWENFQYSMAGSMASNPVTYVLYKVATLLEDTTGGIAIPAISVMGNMVDLETTIADLMRVGALGGGIIDSFGDLITGFGNSFNGQKMLSELGISSDSGITITPRGQGIPVTANGNGSLLSNAGGGSSTVSSSGYGSYAGTSSGSDIKNATLQEAANTKEQLMIEAQEEEESNQIHVLNNTILKIYELLDDVTHGKSCFRVKVDDYGLTKEGSSSAQGGVSALSNFGTTRASSSYSNTSQTSNGVSSSGAAAGGVNSVGINGSINFGGWTTIL